MKDVPTELPEGLAILCVPPREDPRDALISRDGRSFMDLPHGARIGTSSLRRQSQLLHARPDLTIAMLRGNLDTRIKKLRGGQFDAIVLAAAGLRRLDWAHEITEYLSPQISLPAIGQGALGIEGRKDDLFMRSLLSGLDHAESKTAVLAERALLHRLQGGCQVPIAAYATVAGKIVRLEGLVSSVDGKELFRDVAEGTIEEPESIGIQLAERLLAHGGDRILQAIYGTT
jgi:hydroxymethylbilane synthase